MLISLRCVLVLASLVLGGCQAARILAVFPTFSRSHVISFDALTKELARRGHQLTVISMFPQEKPLDNYTDIAVPYSKLGFEKINLYEFNKQSILLLTVTFAKMGGNICEHFLGDPKVQQVIQGKDDLFDLVLVSMFCNECALGFAHKFRVPVIGIAAMSGMHSMHDVMGNTSPYAYIPHVMLHYTDRMSFWQRLHNTVSLTIQKWSRTLLLIPSQDAIMRKHFDLLEPLPHVSELEENMSLLLLNHHVSLEHPRPFMPNIIEVGGLHLKPGGSLPADLQKFLDEATNGVIYFSMGSNLKSAEMPESKRQAFLQAFSQMKQQVLWKWEDEVLPGQPKNVRLGKWLPQAAILAHPNVKVFITHGGLLSMQETIFYGVPMVALPVFADQPLNARKAQALGIGLMLNFDDFTSESLKLTLDTVIGDPSYRKKAKELSARFRDRPNTPLETAVFWTEYVIRHKGAPHLRSAALDLAWYQYFLLDVLAVLVLGAGLLAAVLYLISKAVFSLTCGRMFKRSDKQKTH